MAHAKQEHRLRATQNPETPMNKGADAAKQALKKGVEATKKLLSKGDEIKKRLSYVKEKIMDSSLRDFLESSAKILREFNFFKGEEIGENGIFKKKSRKYKVKKEKSKSPNKPKQEIDLEESSPKDSSKEKAKKNAINYQEAEPTIGTPINRKVDDLKTNGLNQGLIEDHAHNAELLALLPGKEQQINKFLKEYAKNKHRYERVSELVGIPPKSIAAAHWMESGMNFNTYLHNGQKLGKETTFVPKGVLFYEGQWEEAAIHALGGDIMDANGKKSNPYFQNLRKNMGINAQTNDLGKMMAFAERYNGLGYRSRGVRSTYVYAGTNLMEKGRFVADGKFDRTKTSKRVGVAALLLAQQAVEKGKKIKTAPLMTN